MSGPQLSDAPAWAPPGPLVSGVLAVADGLRRRWLRLLGRATRPLIQRRELRVAVMFSSVIATALAGALCLPLWLLLLGPLVWGVPHLAADLRYLVLRTGYWQRRRLWLLAGGPLVVVALGGALVWGFFGAAAVALVARARVVPRLLAGAALLAAGAAMWGLGAAADVVFAHLHNFVAVGFWWLWRPRLGRAHWLPLVLLAAATVFLLAGPAVDLAHALGGLQRFGGGMDADYQLWRLAPGLDLDLGPRLVLLFCFSQSLHYAVWLQLIPDEDRERATPPTFRASHEQLRREFGDLGIAVVALLAVGIAAWAAFDLMAANHGYFRLARFHGHLEIMAGTLLLLERRATVQTGHGRVRLEDGEPASTSSSGPTNAPSWSSRCFAPPRASAGPAPPRRARRVRRHRVPDRGSATGP